MDSIFFVPIIIISLSLVLILISFLSSKTIQEKAVAFDVMTIATTSVLMFLAFIKNASFYLDIAIIYALLSFVAVVIVARYTEKGL